MAKIITRQFSDLQSLLSASIDDLADIHEIGQAIAESVHDFCRSEYGRSTLGDLENAGVYVKEIVSEPQVASEIAGKTIVVTGTLTQFTRDQVKQLIEDLGARASSSVSKKTDFLLAGEKAGSKLSKAKSLGVKALSEDDFREMLRSSGAID